MNETQLKGRMKVSSRGQGTEGTLVTAWLAHLNCGKALGLTACDVGFGFGKSLGFRLHSTGEIKRKRSAFQHFVQSL